ncbi:hypothetical protein G7Y89_g4133 [Cudoniella acicularis]|uniref:Peptidase S8/S53 domain-containing protein n=1 Tax=Cudoniella acicularis TaxID=354080 RepID=A0A8H4RQV6_9HELO|nr:hypothetical protein G7Y89_g4133 [Cudoniella acicularis]
MSLDSIFAPASRDANLSAPLQRRIRLLQAVLPSFASAAAQMFYSAKKYSSTRAFWTDFLSPCLVMESGRWRFHKLDDQHDELLSRLLKSLEKIVSMDKSTIAEEFASSTFPRLETLRKRVNDSPSDAEELLTGYWKIVRPTDQQERSDLVKSLAELAKAAKDDSKQPPPEEAVPVTSRSKSSIAPLLLNLFSTISEYCRCECTRPHRAILLLFTHRFLPKNTDYHSITMLLSRGKSVKGIHWQETEIAIKERSPVPKVQIILPEESAIPEIDQAPGNESLTRVTDLCTTMDNLTTSRLNLNIDGKSMFQHAETDLQLTGLEDVESVSLEEGLFCNETELDIGSKTCLALVLSYSLLDFCWKPWFPGGWTKSGICLLQYSRQLLLRPTLVTYIRQHPKSSDPSKVSSDLKLLFHGILLIEIFKQASLPSGVNLGETVIEDFRVKARKEFDAVKWGVSEGFRQSAGACIDGFQDHKLDTSENTEESFATDFCKAVIGPLERDFISLWGDKDPDQVLSELKLPSIKRKKQPPPPPKPKPGHLKKTPQKPTRPTKPKPSISTSSTQVTHAPIAHTTGRLQLKFFDVDDKPEPKQVQGALNWFGIFDQVRANQALQAKQKKGTKVQIDGRGIKIAILDTGIDPTNSWISSKAGRIQCWPSEDSCKDTDGHGTQVAYLLLRLAPLVRLRIAKVSKSQLLQDADIEKIAKAIEYFSSNDGDRVDIINLSFGFPQFHQRLRPILLALLEARAKNVLVFAAAGNEGGNQGVFWPAKLPEVIRINAADSYGNAAGFSPTDGAGRRICTLGEAVPSCKLDVKNEAVHRSGTSFATPIAVAIAAIVLGFMDGAGDMGAPEDFEQLKPLLRTRSGMESVLCKTCVLQGENKRAGFSYITPWFFLQIEESSRVGIITNELRNCSG